MTNLDSNKQDSVDEIPTTSLRMRGGGRNSKGPGTRASRLGLFLSPSAPEAPVEPLPPGPDEEDTLGSASADPTELPPLIALEASSSTAAFPDRVTTLGGLAVPSATAPVPGSLFPDRDTTLGGVTVPSATALVPGFGASATSTSTLAAPTALAPGFGAPVTSTLVEPSATGPRASTTPPAPSPLDTLQMAQAISITTIQFDISDLMRKANEDRLRQRDTAADLKSCIRELREEMKLTFETMGLLRAERQHRAAFPPDGTALPHEPGASRFTPPPWSRGRSLHDTTRQPTRLANPCHPAPADSPSSSPDKTTYHASTGTPNYPPDRHGAPRQRQRDAPSKLGDSPSTSHDKRHATYCRKLDIASAPASKKYAIIAVITINKVTTVCATDQFRTWTLSRPQSTTVTIETAVWSLLHVGILDAQEIFAEFNPIFCDFRYRIQHGETTDDTLDGILRLTFPDSRDTDPQTSVDAIAQTLHDMNFYDVITTHVQSNAAAKAANNAHLAPIGLPIRAIERTELRRTLLTALMCHPYSEDTHNPRLGDFTMNPTSSSSEHRRTLWGKLPQMDIAAALPQWTAGLSIQAFQQLLITTIHTDTASLIADLLREQDPLPTILAAILRRHHDSNEFTMLVTADIAEHLKSELKFYKDHYASDVSKAQRNYTDARQHRSFLSILCVCLAAIRSAFLGTSRDGALHSEARQFLAQLSTMPSNSDVEYLLEANAYWLRYSKLWGPVLLLNLCDGGQIQTLLPSVVNRLSPSMQEKILLFFGDIAHRLRAAHYAGKLPSAFVSQLSSILHKPLLLHSTIPALHTYGEFLDHGEQAAILEAMHDADMTQGNHNHRIAHPADLAFVGKTGALADYWPAMIRHVLGHYNRVLVAPADKIALVAWDDIYSDIE